jgi:predicted transcriptional regulator
MTTIMVTVLSSPLGSETRTRVMLVLYLLEESYPRELSRLLGVRLAAVQGALRSLERDGLVAGRTLGRNRMFQIDPRYFAVTELRPYLSRLAEADAPLRERIGSLRRRPRRTGKPL